MLALLSKCYLARLQEAIGPQFRYEEETLFPALLQVYDSIYVEKLFTDHDLLIARTKKLCCMLEQKELTDEDYKVAIEHVKAILPIVVSCESISVLMEQFDNQLIQKLKDSHEKAYIDNFNLFKWSETIRKRLPLYLN